VEATLKRFGRLGTVVANAGFATHDTVAEGDPEAWSELALTNARWPALLIRASIDALKGTRGRIVLIGSVAGHVNTPGSIYGATRWAMTGLAENTRRQVTEYGVGGAPISPGRVETPFWDGYGSPGQLLTAERLADSIVWAIERPTGVDVNTVVVRPIGRPVRSVSRAGGAGPSVGRVPLSCSGGTAWPASPRGTRPRCGSRWGTPASS
jgi:NADP-dependent 3-hydroxy acid dehydrogenase YdfG